MSRNLEIQSPLKLVFIAIDILINGWEFINCETQIEGSMLSLLVIIIK